MKEERAKTARLRQTVSDLRAELAAASEANASLSAQHDDTLRNLNDTHDELQQVTANHLLSATKRKRLRALTNELLNKVRVVFVYYCYTNTSALFEYSMVAMNR